VFPACAAELVLYWCSRQFKGRYLRRELVQANGPWPSGHQTGCARTHAMLRRMLLKELQSAGVCYNKAAGARHCGFEWQSLLQVCAALCKTKQGSFLCLNRQLMESERGQNM